MARASPCRFLTLFEQSPFFFNAEVLRKYYVYAIRFRGKSRSRVHALLVFTRDCSLQSLRAEAWSSFQSHSFTRKPDARTNHFSTVGGFDSFKFLQGSASTASVTRLAHP
ncbi:unnamed protein product [Ixodes persulcatus]